MMTKFRAIFARYSKFHLVSISGQVDACIMDKHMLGHSISLAPPKALYNSLMAVFNVTSC